MLRIVIALTLSIFFHTYATICLCKQATRENHHSWFWIFYRFQQEPPWSEHEVQGGRGGRPFGGRLRVPLRWVHHECHLLLKGKHCKDTITKIWNKYFYKKKNWAAASVPISTYMFCELFIHIPTNRSANSVRGKYMGLSSEYINRSPTHECGNWVRPRNFFSGNT